MQICPYPASNVLTALSIAYPNTYRFTLTTAGNYSNQSVVSTLRAIESTTHLVSKQPHIFNSVLMDNSSSTTTGSFQNQTTTSLIAPTTRKRSQTALQDASNLQPTKKSCVAAAKTKITAWSSKKAPRGNPKAAATTRWAQKPQNETEISGESDDNDYTLKQVLLHNQSTFCNGKKSIKAYIERNTGTEMLKAIAITVFSTAVSSWGMGILEAAQKAADVTGASVQSIRKWAAMYFTCIAGGGKTTHPDSP